MLAEPVLCVQVKSAMLPAPQVVRTLVENRCSMAPILSCDPSGSNGDVPTVLHIATLSGVLACLMRHFRASLASLPLLQQPLASMPIGSWSPDSPIGQQGQAGSSAEVRRHCVSGVRQAALCARCWVLILNTQPALRLASGRPTTRCVTLILKKA